SRRPGRLDSERYSDAALLAGLAALALEHSPPGDLAEVGIAAEAAEPWAYPAVVHHATGIVSEQLGLDVEEAMLRLRTGGVLAGGRRVRRRAGAGSLRGRVFAPPPRVVVFRRFRIESWADDA